MAITLLIVAVPVFNACSRSGTNAPVVKNTSVSDLLAKLPNLKPLHIQSCSYTVEASSARTLLPSPSDLRVEIKGSAVLSEAGSRALRSGFEWKPASRDIVPPSLLAIVPPGNVLVSQNLHETFANNPRYPHGFVVALAEGAWSRVYFLATDLDHPIE